MNVSLTYFNKHIGSLVKSDDLYILELIAPQNIKFVFSRGGGLLIKLKMIFINKFKMTHKASNSHFKRLGHSSSSQIAKTQKWVATLSYVADSSFLVSISAKKEKMHYVICNCICKQEVTFKWTFFFLDEVKLPLMVLRHTELKSL